MQADELGNISGEIFLVRRGPDEHPWAKRIRRRLWKLDAKRNTEKAKAYAPYCAGVSQRPRSKLSRNPAPENKA